MIESGTTRYVVLREEPAADGGTSDRFTLLSASEPGQPVDGTVLLFEAASDKGALRQAHREGRLDGSTSAVAVPERSFRRRRPQVQERMSWK